MHFIICCISLVLISYFVCLDLRAGPRKIQKYYFLPMGPREHPKWRGITHLDTRTPKVSFSAKMTKMPLVNLGFTEGQTRSKSTQNNTFHTFHQTRPSRRFLATLTKLTSGGPKNPNIDSVVRTGWNQCHCKDYQILIPMTIHRSKSELERPRYHENRVNTPIDAPLTS